jgi:hypothetical protein
VHREFFTVDLRGLRAGLKERAARSGVTETAVLRGALATALGTDQVDPAALLAGAGDPKNATRAKLSVRLSMAACHRLDHNARAAGLSRSLYLTRLIGGAPPVVASRDREAMVEALNASSAELAVLSRDINDLTRLLRHGSVEAARRYTARHDELDSDVQHHLALAAAVLAELSSMCLAGIQSRVERRVGSRP